jgi:hypothetical protein
MSRRRSTVSEDETRSRSDEERDEVEGHMDFLPKDEERDEVEGHMDYLPKDEERDEVEGHLPWVAKSEEKDDDEGDDVEGHQIMTP